MGKLPGFIFMTGDWMKDPELRSVTSGARGLWIDMMCLMHESARRGYLQFNNGKAVAAEYLARMTGNSTDDVSRWLQELEYSGVLSRTEDGVIYSRRMVRDEKERAGNRDRKRKERSCHSNVTGDVTPLSVNVNEREVDSAFTPTEVSKFVCDGMELSGREMVWLATDAVGIAMAKWKCDSQTAAERIVEKWRDYELLPIDFKVGKKKFLAESKFIDEFDAQAPLPRAGQCKKHPDSGSTINGACWACSEGRA